MRVGYYWPNLFKDAHAWARKCKQCVLFARKERLVALPLHPILVDQPFLKLGIDFVAPINPNSNVGNRWIFTATDNFTRWKEAIALWEAKESSFLNFCDELATRFGVPESIIFDNVLAFVGARTTEWALKNGVYLALPQIVILEIMVWLKAPI